MFINSNKTKLKFGKEEEDKEMLKSSESNKMKNNSINLNSSNKENSFSKFEVLNFTFKKENYAPLRSSKKNNKINLGSRDKEINSFKLLNLKRTSNFTSGLSFSDIKTDFDFYSNGNFYFICFVFFIFMLK